MSGAMVVRSAIATGPVSLRYDPRDLADGRFVFRAVEARSPLLVIRKELDGHWNFRKVFPVTDTTTRPVVRLPHGAFGALVLLHDIRVRGGEVRLVKPWHPDDSLGGSRRAEFIGQIFNVFGRNNLGGIGSSFQTNALSDTFGQLTTAQPRQQAELAVRFTF